MTYDFPGGSHSKNLPTLCETVWRRSPGEENGNGNGNPLQHSCLENSRPMPGQRSPAGYSPLGCKESDRTERLHFHFPDSNAKICQKYKKENSKPIFLMDTEQKKKSLKNIRV